MRTEDLRIIMISSSYHLLTEPELENQANLITKYRVMLKHINKKHMENLIMVELQNRFNKDRISGFIIQAHRIPQDITEGPRTVFRKTQGVPIRKTQGVPMRKTVRLMHKTVLKKTVKGLQTPIYQTLKRRVKKILLI